MLLFYPFATHAEDNKRSNWEVGIRIGQTFVTKDKNIEQLEIFLRRELPLSWQLSESVRVGVAGELSVGLMDDHRYTSMVSTLGPDIFLDIGPMVRLRGGSRLTLLSTQHMEHYDFGGITQYTSHVGITFRCGTLVTLGYRFQHMSNAHMYYANPGLNINMLELGTRF